MRPRDTVTGSPATRWRVCCSARSVTSHDHLVGPLGESLGEQAGGAPRLEDPAEPCPRQRGEHELAFALLVEAPGQPPRVVVALVEGVEVHGGGAAAPRRGDEALERAGEVLEHGRRQDGLVPGPVRQRGVLRHVTGQGPTLGGHDLVVELETGQPADGRGVGGVAPVPPPDRVLPVREPVAVGGHRRRQRAGLVVGVTVGRPGTDDQAAARRVVLDLRLQRGLVLAELAVGQPEEAHRAPRQHGGHRGLHLQAPAFGELGTRGGGRLRVRGLAVGGHDDGDRDVAPGAQGQQAARPQ